MFDVGADLCVPINEQPERPALRVTEEYVARLERWCDEYNARLAKLDSFVLPGGTAGAALLHLARTVARRAERTTWRLIELAPERTNPLAAKYLNRLSDLLFILARVANPDGDIKWLPTGTGSARSELASPAAATQTGTGSARSELARPAAGGDDV